MSQLPEIPDRTTGLEPWPVQGPPQVVFEHAFFPTVMEQDVRLPGGKVVPWLRYANHRDGREIRDGVRPRGSDAPADEGEVIEPMFLPIGRIDAMIRSGKIDNVTVLAGWALVRAAGRLSTA